MAVFVWPPFIVGSVQVDERSRVYIADRVQLQEGRSFEC